jgi:hypothetical protein
VLPHAAAQAAPRPSAKIGAAARNIVRPFMGSSVAIPTVQSFPLGPARGPGRPAHFTPRFAQVAFIRIAISYLLWTENGPPGAPVHGQRNGHVGASLLVRLRAGRVEEAELGALRRAAARLGPREPLSLPQNSLLSLSYGVARRDRTVRLCRRTEGILRHIKREPRRGCSSLSRGHQASRRRSIHS